MGLGSMGRRLFGDKMAGIIHSTLGQVFVGLDVICLYIRCKFWYVLSDHRQRRNLAVKYNLLQSIRRSNWCFQSFYWYFLLLNGPSSIAAKLSAKRKILSSDIPDCDGTFLRVPLVGVSQIWECTGMRLSLSWESTGRMEPFLEPEFLILKSRPRWGPWLVDMRGG